MILLFTDFGLEGPYVGQVKHMLAREAPGVPVIDLFADAPPFEPRLGAYLLAAHAWMMEDGDVLLGIVDPDVGTLRVPLVVRADRRWYVGPDNGLFELVARRAREVRSWRIAWQPPRLSASFHGRDLFAPVAAQLARGEAPPGPLHEMTRFADWPDDLAAVVHVDRYGNAMTGLRAATLAGDTRLVAGGREIARARTFADVPRGEALWYENANGLAEIAVNGGRAADVLGLAPGSGVGLSSSSR
jgi:S-adenosyl-L-methionine hydrolase (adenosine-forming)